MTKPRWWTHLFRIASLVVPSWLAWFVAFTTNHADTLNRAVALVMGPLWGLLSLGLVTRALSVRFAVRPSGEAQTAASRLDRIDLLTPAGCALAWTASMAIIGALTVGWVSLAVVGLMGAGLFHLVVLHTMVVARPGATLRGASITRSFSPASPTEGDAVIEELRLVDVAVPIGFRLFLSGRVGRRWATTRHVLDAADAGGEVVIESAIGPAVRGDHAPEALEAWLEDSLGLCRVPCAPVSAPQLVVLPRARKIDRTAPLLRSGGGPSAAQAKRGVPTEGHLDLREYREGDDVRRIHWVRSLVAGELVVRVPDEVPPDQPRVRLVLDTFFPEARWLACDAPDELLDGLVATWLALGTTLVEAGYRVTLVAAVDGPDGVAASRCELSSRARGPALRLGARARWQSEVEVDRLLTRERTIVVARGVVSQLPTRELARWVVVRPELSEPPLPPQSPAFLRFPMGSRDNHLTERLRIGREMWRARRDHYLTARVAGVSLTAAPPGSIAARTGADGGTIRLEALS
jgi:uncharacterized protein (DUF58 family)